MKQWILALSVATLSACGAQNTTSTTELSSAVAPILEGKSYCRTVISNGEFGQPRGKRQHCLTFVDAVNVIDNSPTFFGNPPQTGVYFLEDHTLLTSFNNEQEKDVYSLSRDNKTLTSVGGLVLTLSPTVVL